MVEWEMPSAVDNESFIRWVGRLQRMSCSPKDFVKQLESVVALDAGDAPERITTRTLVMHVKGDRVLPVAGGRLLAELIPDAQYVEVPGDDHFAWIMPSWRELCDILIEFATGSAVARMSTRRFATVLFTDIRNFTALCENHPPALTIGLLNRYLTSINAIVDEHDGVIDKYTGDGVMALFGAPIGRSDDPQRAVLAALAIDARMRQLAKELAEEHLPNPDVGIGVNTARVVAGNIGSPTRLNYTVLGDGVNLASRLEGLTKRYQVSIIVGETTAANARNLVYLELDKVRVLGKTRAVRIFQPLGPAAQLDLEMRNLVDRHHRALALFRARKWATAETIFAELAPVARYARIAEIYLGYVREYIANEPGADWDCAFTLSDK